MINSRKVSVTIEGRNVFRESKPVSARISGFDMFKEIAVVLDGAFVAIGRCAEAEIIRMHIDKGHAAARSDPGDLVLPNLVRAFL